MVLECRGRVLMFKKFSALRTLSWVSLIGNQIQTEAVITGSGDFVNCESKLVLGRCKNVFTTHSNSNASVFFVSFVDDDQQDILAITFS